MVLASQAHIVPLAYVHQIASQKNQLQEVMDKYNLKLAVRNNQSSKRPALFCHFNGEWHCSPIPN